MRETTEMRNRVNRQSMAIRESSKPDVPMRVTLGRHRSVVRLCPFKRRVFRLHQGTAILVPLAPSICLVLDRGHHFLDSAGSALSNHISITEQIGNNYGELGDR